MIYKSIVIVLIIIFLKGILTCVKTSIFNMVSKKGMEQEEYILKNKFANKVIASPRKYIVAINVVSSILVIMLGILISERLCEEFISLILKNNIHIEIKILKPLVILLLVLVISYFTILFGNVIPKRITNKKYKKLSVSFINLAYLIYILLFPMVKLLYIAAGIYAKLFGGVPSLDDEDITHEKILMMIDEGEEIGTIDENEKEMISNIFDFNNKTAEDICTHRKHIFALPFDSDIEEIIEVVTKEKYSRIPIYEDNIDNIIGILHIKDIIKYLVKYNKDNFNLKSILREPFFVPTSKKSDELFEEMQKNKVHMSIVIDEYGGTAGIVTMEDLIEEIMGSILDEYDDEEKPDIDIIDEYTYMINGAADLKDVSECLEISFPFDDYDTMSGFIVGQLGRIPNEDEHSEIKYCNFIFKIEKIEEKRISIIRAVRIRNTIDVF